VHWNSVSSTTFIGDNILALPTKTSTTFLVPANANLKNIDAVYVKVDEKKETVLVVPFQIAINKKFKDSEILFYSEWSRWQTFYKGYTLSSTFMRMKILGRSSRRS